MRSFYFFKSPFGFGSANPAEGASQPKTCDVEKADTERIRSKALRSKHARKRCGQSLLPLIQKWLLGITKLFAILFLFILTIVILSHEPSYPESTRLMNTPTNLSSLIQAPSGNTSAFWASMLPEKPVRRQFEERYRIVERSPMQDFSETAIVMDMQTGKNVILKVIDLHRGDVMVSLPAALKGVFDYHVQKWPVEIPAALGLTHRLHQSSNPLGPAVRIVPLLDYFLHCPYPDCSFARWYTITPLLTDLTLSSHASQIRSSNSTSTHILHALYHRSLTKMLATLSWFHQQGICHDAISPNAFFVEHTDGHMIVSLGALHHVREVSHPYHFSRQWAAQEQYPDCRLNDVRMALKTYLSFLRAATNDTVAFDRQMFAGVEPWSRLYWRFMRTPALADSVSQWTEAISEERVAAEEVVSKWMGREPGWVPWSSLWSAKKVLARAVEYELRTDLQSFSKVRRERIGFAGWWIESAVVTGPVGDGRWV